MLHEQISRSRRPSEWMSTQTTSEHRVLEAAVLASEIEQLADLQGYLKFASTPQRRRVGL